MAFVQIATIMILISTDKKYKSTWTHNSWQKLIENTFIQTQEIFS